MGADAFGTVGSARAARHDRRALFTKTWIESMGMDWGNLANPAGVAGGCFPTDIEARRRSGQSWNHSFVVAMERSSFTGVENGNMVVTSVSCDEGAGPISHPAATVVGQVQTICPFCRKVVTYIVDTSAHRMLEQEGQSGA